MLQLYCVGICHKNNTEYDNDNGNNHRNNNNENENQLP